MDFKKIFLIVFFLFLFLNISFAATYDMKAGKMKIFAVDTKGEGIQANLIVRLVPGNGKVLSQIISLIGKSTQQTEKTVVDLASKYNKDAKKYDYIFSIQSNAKEIDGPSAGLPIALLTIATLNDLNLKDYISGTGTIGTDGSIGRIGGLLAKTKKASESGIKLFLVPKSELEVIVKDGNVKKVNLSKYAYNKWGIKVVGVDDLNEVFNVVKQDLSNIKINKIKTKELLIYNPPKTTFNSNLDSFYNFLNNYSQQAQESLNTTKEALNNTNINNTDILNILYEELTNANKLYEDGNKALENNYLYSSANYFFLSKISSNTVYDISQNPEILTDYNSLKTKADKLKEQINLFEKQIENIPYNNYEWNISAKERLLWAENYLSQISKVDVIISTEPNITKMINLKKVNMYEFAKEWFEMAKLFNSYTKQPNKILSPTKYKPTAEKLLKEVEKSKKFITKSNKEDLERRIYGAKEAFNNHLYITSIYESATILALINSQTEMTDKDYKQIEKMTKTKLDLINNIKDKNYIWSNLYLQHAIYFYNGALFYAKNNHLTNAKNNIKSAYQMVSLAYNLSQTEEDLEKNKDFITIYTTNLDIKEKTKYNKLKTIGGFDYDLLKNISIIFLFVILFLIVIFVVIYKTYKQKNYSNVIEYLDYRIFKTKEFIISLDKKFINNKISINDYKKLKTKYNNELKELEAQKKKTLDVLEDIEATESEIQYINEKINNTNSLFKRGLIDKEEYYKRINRFKKEMTELNQDIKIDKNQLNTNLTKTKNKKTNPKITKKKITKLSPKKKLKQKTTKKKIVKKIKSDKK